MEEGKKKKKGTENRSSLNTSFVTGAIALVFLIIGYQIALFVHKAAVTYLAANRDHPDTVYVIDRQTAQAILSSREPPRLPEEGPVTVRKQAPHSPAVEQVREKAAPPPVKNFRFDPNTVSVRELQQLGFSEKQAQAIERYRSKGGRFRRKEDFAKSYVVGDSVYARLEPYIDIPRLDINRADSLALLSLPGIGPYFAGRILDYRERLQGFSCPEQLLEIYHFDPEKLAALEGLITCSEVEPYPLWTLSEEELSRHPHISRREAHGIVLYREHHKGEACTLEGLQKAGVLSEEHAGRLSLCRISPAP